MTTKERAERMARVLSKETVIIHVVKTRWGGTKVDKGSSETLATDAGGDKEGWTNASFKLIPPELKKAYDKKYAEVGAAIKDKGLPMLGGFVIRVTDYDDVRRKTDNEVAEFIGAADELAMKRSRIVADCQAKLGASFSESAIPSEAEIRSASGVKIHVTPLGSVPEGIEGAETINAHLEQQYKAAVDGQMQIIKDLIGDTKKIISEVLSGETKSFKSNRWDNLKAELSKLKGLNINNPEIDGVLGTIDALTNVCSHYKSGDIKGNTGAANTLTRTVDTMADILAAM